MIFELKIRKAENGYVCQWKESLDDGGVEKKETLIVEKDGYDDERLFERESMAELLWFVTEYFGVSNEKHDKSRISVGVQTRMWDKEKEDWGDWQEKKDD